VRRFIAAVLVTAAIPVFTQQSQTSLGEHEVKAAYLAQFGRYVEGFPVGELARPLLICVLGEDPFGTALDTAIAGKVISGRQLAARRILGLADSRDCQILFVSRSQDDRLPAILKALEGRMVLTVGDGPQFTRRGGMIGFIVDDKKVRFVVNLMAAEAAKVTLSSQLLRVAARVEQ
jgi:hypothetical protein